MADAIITLEGDADGSGHLRFELPPDVTEDEIAYLESLIVRADSETLELIDPATGEVVFSCDPVLVH